MASIFDQLIELQNQLQNLYTQLNAIQQKMYDMYYSTTPTDIQIPQINPDGTITNVTVPNHAKIKQMIWDDVGGALGQFNKTVFVDSVNGDDTNPGTIDAPFKTVQKAVDSIPTGGRGVINIIGDYYHNTSAIIVYNKDITFILKGTLTIDYYTRLIGTTTYYEYSFISANNSSIKFYLNSDYNSKIVINDVPDGVSITPYSGAFKVSEQVHYGNFFIQLTIKEDNYNPIIVGNNTVLFTISEWSSERPCSFNFSISGNYSGTNRSIVLKQNSKIANLRHTPSNIYINYTGGFVDENGNSVDPANYIDGIVKDSNGIPRNVISNIVF